MVHASGPRMLADLHLWGRDPAGRWWGLIRWALTVERLQYIHIARGYQPRPCVRRTHSKRCDTASYCGCGFPLTELRGPHCWVIVTAHGFTTLRNTQRVVGRYCGEEVQLLPYPGKSLQLAVRHRYEGYPADASSHHDEYRQSRALTSLHWFRTRDLRAHPSRSVRRRTAAGTHSHGWNNPICTETFVWNSVSCLPSEHLQDMGPAKHVTPGL
jgi:hypothetical protein